MTFSWFAGDNILDLPPDSGSPLFQFILHPDNSAIDKLTPEIFQVCMAK